MNYTHFDHRVAVTQHREMIEAAAAARWRAAARAARNPRGRAARHHGVAVVDDTHR